MLRAMPLWGPRRASPQPASVDEFLAEGTPRAATPLALGRDWQARLAALTRTPAQPADLALPAFTLLRGGDLYEPPRRAVRLRTEPALLARYEEVALTWAPTRVAPEVRAAARAGLLRVLAGNPAVCRRLMLAKPMEVVLVPESHDLRDHGFPPHTHPHALGVFWNAPGEPRARLGLRAEHVLPKPYLMSHELMHAVHLLALTPEERKLIDAHLRPTYGSTHWIEEVVAIHAERALGARYGEEELRAPEPYGHVRREWSPRTVFARFMDELLRPEAPPSKAPGV
jgi:hypothetical protein